MADLMLSQTSIATFQQGVKAIQQELEAKILGNETSNNLFKAINKVKEDLARMSTSGNKQLEESILSNVSMIEENLTRQNDLIRDELSSLSGKFEEHNEKFLEQIEQKFLKQSTNFEAMSQKFEKLEQQITTGGAGAFQHSPTQNPQSILTQSSYLEDTVDSVESGPLTLDHIDWKKYQFGDCFFMKKKIKIQHPYMPVQNDNSHRDTIEVAFEGEVYKQAPHGLGYVTYDNSGEGFLNFQGVATFNKGVMDGGPAIFQCEDGQRLVFSSMQKGRPSGCGKKYLATPFDAHVTTVNKKINVGGWAYYIGNFKDAQFNGQGALMLCDPQGTLFNGKFEKDLMHSGKQSVLPASGKGAREIYHAQFNLEEDLKNRKHYSKQAPVTSDQWTPQAPQE
ncbi:hypothetical protein FGO68_gene8520 [Halteria grandinella]|uniref:Uncharacterized protein n=1 Tax=Halteria grandinella TaxID=5974 RepID=A0A8J8NQA1_HALGN|nr:hypothetical protein FGO68_gene8520 [Halteria grandinella]